jgi:hypothetical protein
MAIREDVIVYWEESPRIIEVLAPSTEITIQDLVDTLRFLEYDIKNQCYPYLVDSYGKQYLSEGKYVGITLALRNARVKFQSRPGPDWVRCRVTGGNLVAYDENDQPMPAIEVSSYTQVTVELDVSPALIVTGGSALTQEEHNQLMNIPNQTLETDEHNKLMAIPSETMTTEEHDALMQIDGKIDTMQVDIDIIGSDVDLLMSFIKNEKYLSKEGSVWYLVIRNDDDTADILKKALKDKNGDNITDIQAGVLAQELQSSV